jgi:hypothetical protein
MSGTMPGDNRAFHHLGILCDFCFKGLEAIGGVPVHADTDIGGQFQAEPGLVQQRDVGADDA